MTDHGEQPFTIFGLPLRVTRLQGQQIFALFLLYTFLTNEEYRLHSLLLAIVTIFAIRRNQ
jgi:hypothetical protein